MKKYTDDFREIGEFHTQILGTEPTKLGIILSKIGLGHLIKEQENKICIALGIHHNNQKSHIYTPYADILISGSQEKIYNHLNNPDINKINMNLWSQEQINKLQQAADHIYDKYHKEKGKLSS